MHDLELLGEYVQTGSEAAFAELVRRHIDWVQESALRQVGRRQVAEGRAVGGIGGECGGTNAGGAGGEDYLGGGK